MTKNTPIKWHTANIKLSQLKEYPDNPRKITKEMMDKLVAHIKEDGYHQRIIVDSDYTIIGGHQRKKALYMAGFNDDTEIEVLMPNKKLTPKEIDRLNIRDNLAFGEYDFEVLTQRFDIDELVSFGMDKDILTPIFDKDILEEIGEEEEIEVSQEATAKLGDIYLLGSHRLMCGDSTNPQHVEKLIDGANPILMVTDPPYGVNYEPEWRECDLGDGERSKGKVINDDRYDWSDAYLLFTGDIAYIWHPSKYIHKFAENIESSGFELINLIIWSKQHFTLSRGDYHYQHEPLWYAVRKEKNHNWQGKRDQSTVWEIENNNSFGNSNKEETWGHGTQKPIECMLRPILNNSAQGQSIYDPFGGSGTTLIACERSKRNSYMMELSPTYVDVIIKRWEKETGKKAVLLNE